MRKRCAPLPVPDDIIDSIEALDCKRLGLDRADLDIEYAAYFPTYCTGSVGYSGPVVIVVWGGGPEMVSSYIKHQGEWKHCAA